MYAKNNEKRRDPHPICRQSVEKQFPRTLTSTSPRYPLDTVYLSVPGVRSWHHMKLEREEMYL